MYMEGNKVDMDKPVARDELIKVIIEKGMSLYVSRIHTCAVGFVLDMESRGIKRSILQMYFDYLLLPDGRLIEICGVDQDSGEVMVRTLINENGELDPIAKSLGRLRTGNGS
jgi:hypothetical protein